jgi:hypothetical protein
LAAAVATIPVNVDLDWPSNAACVTFNSEALCDEETFAIEDMEVFGFLIGHF